MNAFSGENVSWETEPDGVLTVRLHRAPCNEISTESAAELDRLSRWLHRRDCPARAVVWTSEMPGGFCAGDDLREAAGWIGARQGVLASARAIFGGSRWFGTLHRIFRRLDRAPQVSIAAVHGVCFGGGLELALTADIIVADRTARFALPELRLGVVPAVGGIPRMEREVGNAVIRELMFTGRSIRAQRAHTLGLVAEVVGPGKAPAVATRMARWVSGYDPTAVRRAKRFVKRPPRARLLAERLVFATMVGRPAVAAALSDFVERDDALPYLRKG